MSAAVGKMLHKLIAATNDDLISKICFILNFESAPLTILVQSPLKPRLKI